MLSELIKSLDRLAGPMLVSLLGSMPGQRETAVQSILVIRPGGIGDAVLLLPMLMQLSQRYPGATIHLLAERRNAEVFSWSPVVSGCYCYDHLSDLPRLFRQRYDLIIDTEQWYRLSAIFARLLRPPRLIGFAGNGREGLLSDAVPYDIDRYEVTMFLSLLEPLGRPAGCGDLPDSMVLPEAALARAAGLLAPLGERPLVALFPGASVPEKVWPVQRFMELAEAIVKQGCLPVIVGGEKEKSAGERIAAVAGGINFAGRTSLSETVALLARCCLLVSGDSGLLHAAALLKIPSVALFGPSNPLKWASQGEGRVIVCHNPGCGPCSRYGTIPVCNEGVRCMAAISVDEVCEEVRRILASLVK